MHKLIEFVATGALYTFAPLVLLLAVDLICWTVPTVLKSMTSGVPLMECAHAKRGPNGTQSGQPLS
jgi:hypothetical protein